MTFYKEVLSAIAIVLTFVAFVPYIRAILKCQVKPHVFSWAIWSITTLVVFFAQVSEGAGVGAWATGVSGCVTVIIAGLAYWKRADITITRLDWLFFNSALLSLPIWYFISDPLLTVVILTTVDVLGFGPTIRKAYSLPYSESLLFFMIFAIRDSLVIAALESYSIATVLFPASIVVSCSIICVIMMYRRKLLIN
ncbi:MAG: hypothetical protein R8G33_08110 [Gammaproteobacteria bacterium]|nr:hypothetical protein [Gammaproteobacteria bacterium]